jgi:hypothetical protein
MWTKERPKASGFYWHQDVFGDIQVVMRDRDGQLWSSALDDQSEVPLTDEGGEYWDAPISPLLWSAESSLLHDILTRKRWLF